MKIESIAVSRHKGTRKEAAPKVLLKKNFGIEGDAHAGTWHRQVSFLAAESIDAARARGLSVTFGDFAENFATRGVDWTVLPVGTRVGLGSSAVVEITQIGKECHKKCASAQVKCRQNVESNRPRTFISIPPGSCG